MKNLRIISELERISASNGGFLLPEKVVEVARNPKSVLHNKFEWSNDKAAHEYRLWQARQLITLSVTVLSSGQELQTFVSLSTDRPGRCGYRHTVDVLQDEELKAQLLRDALADMNTFQRRYSELSQLAQLFAAIRKTKKKLGKAA